MIRFGQYKYVFNSMESEELYDLAADPDETVNLAADPGMSGTRDEGARRLVENMNKSSDPLATTVTHLCGAGL